MKGQICELIRQIILLEIIPIAFIRYSIDDNHVGRPKKKRGEFWVWKEAIEDPTFFDELFEFLKSTTPFIKKVGQIDTQDLESLHANIARTRPKMHHFGPGNDARVEIAIARINDIHLVS